MDREQIYNTEDSVGRMLMDSFLKAYPEGYKDGTVILDPDKMMEFKALYDILRVVAKDTNAVIKTDVLQQSPTSGYIYIIAKEIELGTSDLFMKAVELCPVVEVSTVLVGDGVVEIAFAVNNLAKRI